MKCSENFTEGGHFQLFRTVYSHCAKLISEEHFLTIYLDYKKSYSESISDQETFLSYFPIYLSQARLFKKGSSVIRQWAFLEWGIYSVNQFWEKPEILQKQLKPGSVQLHPQLIYHICDYDFSPWLDNKLSNTLLISKELREKSCVFYILKSNDKVDWLLGKPAHLAIFDEIIEGHGHVDNLLLMLRNSPLNAAGVDWVENIDELAKKGILIREAPL